ncbi:hypothetical protein ACPOLB_03740 [Rubrivivax sp. RP6-9]
MAELNVGLMALPVSTPDGGDRLLTPHTSRLRLADGPYVFTVTISSNRVV